VNETRYGLRLQLPLTRLRSALNTLEALNIDALGRLNG